MNEDNEDDLANDELNQKFEALVGDLEKEFTQIQESEKEAETDKKGNQFESPQPKIQTEEPTDSELMDQALAQAQIPQIDRRVCRALILTPVVSASGLAALCSLADLDVQVIDTNTGVALFKEVAMTSQQWQMAGLLGSEFAPPEELEKLASRVCQLTHSPVILMMCLLNPAGSIDPGISGQVSAWRFTQGKLETKMPAGLIVARMSAVIEDLLLGRSDPKDHEEFQSSKTLPRWKAMLMLGRTLHESRKKNHTTDSKTDDYDPKENLE